jgi:hypothetical protein
LGSNLGEDSKKNFKIDTVSTGTEFTFKISIHLKYFAVGLFLLSLQSRNEFTTVGKVRKSTKLHCLIKDTTIDNYSVLLTATVITVSAVSILHKTNSRKPGYIKTSSDTVL